MARDREPPAIGQPPFVAGRAARHTGLGHDLAPAPPPGQGGEKRLSHRVVLVDPTLAVDQHQGRRQRVEDLRQAARLAGVMGAVYGVGFGHHGQPQRILQGPKQEACQ